MTKQETSGMLAGSQSGLDAWRQTYSRAALDCLPGIFYLVDAKGLFLDWNSNLETVSGYSSQELAEMSAFDLFEPELSGQVSAAMQKVFEIGRASLEAPMLTRFGTTKPYNYYGSRVEIEGKVYIAGMGLDVTRLKEAQQAQAEQAQQLRHLAAHVPGVIYQLRLDPESGQMSLPFASRKIFEVLGVHHEDVADDAAPLFDRIFSDDVERINRAVDLSARELSTFREQFRLCPPGGSAEHAEWVEVESTPERVEDGVILWHGFARSITERRRMEEELSRLAYNDSLTGMPNRTMLQISLEERISDASIMGHGVAILHLDLDNFKDINDVWGHSTGDRLLIRLAERLSECVDDGGIIGRLGGDEFLVLLDGPEVADKSAQLADRLCAILDTPLDLDRRVVRVTGSIGISLFPDDGETSEDLLRHADAAVYRAKANGPGSWARYSPELTAAAMARRYMETELRSAIDNDQLSVALQPIVKLPEAQVMGYEALARWHHPDDGWIDPEQFVALAESRGLVASLGEQVYRKAMIEVAKMNGKMLSINVAPAQLCDAGFAESLVAMAQRCGLKATCLEVEITERVFLEEDVEALRQINRLREYGVSVAIDDFGTGYSSLAYLRKLPIQRLKIDQSFVRDVENVRENAAIVKAIVAMARELGLAVTAEGVQTAAEFEYMCEAGCDLAQGWHFGRGKVIGDIARAAFRSGR
jgi:diguanylate cyclase (GGDEF)-like protein/PAS domain S-box-containing protein